MHIRCLHCKGVTWFDPEEETSERVPCQWCKRRIHPTNPPYAGDNQARHRAVLRLAEANRMDLPSANSVLIGLMTLREALAIQGKRSVDPAAPPTPSQEGKEALRRLRASKNTWRVRLNKKRRAGWTPREKQVGLLVAAGLFATSIAVGLTGWNAWQQETTVATTTVRPLASPSPTIETPVETPAATPASRKPKRPHVPARVLRDTNGRVLRITGSSPETVLRAFCLADESSHQLEPVELTSTRPGRAGSRIGILRDYRDLMTSYGIWIQRRHSDRQWTAGDGRQPLRPFVVDPERIGDMRVPVAADDERDSSGRGVKR